MFFAIIIVPLIGWTQVGGFSGIAAAAAGKEISLALVPSGFSIVAIISTMAWGLGYFGQPHILARFMSIKHIKELPQATAIAIIWVIISLGGAVVVGLVGIAMFNELPGGDAEKVFIYMVRSIFSPWIGGVLLAAILSAIMSTIDSQLLVSSSTLTEDFYKKVLKKDASEKELMFVGRICVMGIALIAMILAMRPNSSILGLVSYAWGGFRAAFCLVVLLVLCFACSGKKLVWAVLCMKLSRDLQRTM